jgi:trans-aconitate methyltransferase
VDKLRAVRPHQSDEIVGVDASEKMLTIAHERGVHTMAELVCGDFSHALPAGPFDAVFVGYNTLFNLPSEAAIASCMSLVASVLSPTGFFLTDLVIPDTTEEIEHSSLRTMANGDVIKSVSHLNPTERTISGYFAHLENGVETAQRKWRVHFVMPHQLDELAIRAGLVLAERTADGNGTEFTADSSRHISRYILR